MPAISTIEDQLDAIEARIATVSDVTVIDRIEQAAQDTGNAHGGVIVNATASDVQGDTRQRGVARVIDTITVDLSWQIEQSAQKTSRNAAMAKARDIRRALTASAWNSRTRYDGETRESAKGWYFISQTYEFDRIAELGA